MGRKEKNIQSVTAGSRQPEVRVRSNGKDRNGDIKRSTKGVLDEAKYFSESIETFSGVFNLPSVELSDRRKLPELPGLYFVIHESEIVYIGRAKNIKKRWRAHHRFKQLNKSYRFCKIAWLVCSDITLLAQIEKALIAYWNPQLNNSCVEDNKTKSKPGRIKPDWETCKFNRGFRLTQACHNGLQKLADHYGDRSRAEFLERYVRAECDRLGISLEPVAEPAEGEQEAA